MNMKYWNCAKKKQIAKEIISLLGRALYRYRKGQRSNPGKIEFLLDFFPQLHKLRLKTGVIFFAI